MTTEQITTIIVVSVIVFIPLLAISILLLIGKGSFFIAGYNTMSKEKKAQYNEVALCKFIGLMLLIINVCILSTSLGFMFHNLIVAGIFGFGFIAAIVFTLCFTNSKKFKVKA